MFDKTAKYKESGTGGTTPQKRRTRKINVLRVFVFKVVTDLVMDFLIP